MTEILSVDQKEFILIKRKQAMKIGIMGWVASFSCTFIFETKI